MKALRSLTTVVGIVVCICGCATTGTNGVVQIGPDTYMIGGGMNGTLVICEL